MSGTETVSADAREDLYYRMLLIRRVEERIKAGYHLREMRSPPHLYMGHEAVAAGACAALRTDDVVFPYYRSHGWYLAKGGNLNAMFAELFASPAKNVSLFFSDLLGYRDIYNAPGTVSDENWRLRVAPDHQRQYAADIADAGDPRALALPRALAMALRADRARRDAHAPLLARLDAFADEHGAAAR